MDFIAEYDFEIRRRKGKANLVLNFLSRFEGEEPKMDEVDEGYSVNLIETTEDEYEYHLVRIEWFLRSGRLNPMT